MRQITRNMNKKVTVLGAGLVGKAIAIDLAKSGFEVSVLDNNNQRLLSLKNIDNISTLSCDILNIDDLVKGIGDADIVAGALPGALGFQTLKSVIDMGKNIVDISFCPENYMELDNLAKEKGVTAIVDMGVAPGMCNAILGFTASKHNVLSYKCIVGGLPVKREWPFEYKASWSPRDVIEEYTRPARLKENDTIISKPAMSDMQLVNLDPVGTLEEWNSDGLRSLLYTMPDISHMVEKTLRYPGSMEFMKMLQHTGFFSEKPVKAGDTIIKPVDLSAALLLPQWKLEEGEDEFTIMKVSMEIEKNGSNHLIEYTLFDRYDAETNTSSMARTTGYSCTAAIKLVLEDTYANAGINPPELVGAHPQCLEGLLNHLRERNVMYTKSEI